MLYEREGRCPYCAGISMLREVEHRPDPSTRTYAWCCRSCESEAAQHLQAGTRRRGKPDTRTGGLAERVLHAKTDAVVEHFERSILAAMTFQQGQQVEYLGTAARNAAGDHFFRVRVGGVEKILRVAAAVVEAECEFGAEERIAGKLLEPQTSRWDQVQKTLGEALRRLCDTPSPAVFVETETTLVC